MTLLDPAWAAILLTFALQAAAGVWMIARISSTQTETTRVIEELRTALRKLQDLYTETHARLAIVEDRQNRELIR